MDQQTTKFFVILSGFATLCVAVVAIIAIWLGASWAAVGIIVGIVGATMCGIVPVAQKISLRFRQGGERNTELDVGISTRSEAPSKKIPANHSSEPSEPATISILVVQGMEISGTENAHSLIIKKALDSGRLRPYLRTLDNVTTADLASALRKHWDIVHFDCVVDSEGQLLLSTGEVVPPKVLRQFLDKLGIKLLVFTNCDSVRVVGAVHGAGVRVVIAAAGTVLVKEADAFVKALYGGIGQGEELENCFRVAQSSVAAMMGTRWDVNDFCLQVSGPGEPLKFG